MHKVMFIVVFGALAVASVLNYGEAQTVHAVGDTIGWIVPPGGAAVYSNWTSADTFKVGDILVFNFITGRHDVLEVAKDSFDACTTDNAIGTSLTDGPAHVTLNSTGDHYYICTFGTHCKLGQKLAVTASGGNGGPPAGANPPSPAGGPSSSNSSPPGGSTQSHSSATAVHVGLALTMASIAITVLHLYWFWLTYL
ncbi:PREDICTED: umecyanin-like [Ipomoea nil]|uniref:umecyanin-like n=1 Tax=Ipomoea nil TaxID=35883 RepID=UPI0009012B5F|nr:PREDICTED: umecyanin-like [Ipomoea nil]